MAYGKARVVNTPGNAAGGTPARNNNAAPVRPNESTRDSGSAASSYNQVQGRIIDHEGVIQPTGQTPTGTSSDRDPSRMNPVFARKLEARNALPDFDNYRSNAENAELYVDAQGNQRLVPNSARNIDLTGYRKVDRAEYENQRLSDFRPNPGRVNSLGYAVSDDPNVVAYVSGTDDAGNPVLTTTRKNRVPESANIVYDYQGNLSERSVQRLGGSIDPGTQRIRRDAEIQLYDSGILERQQADSAERAAGLRVNTQNRAEIEANQRFGEAERMFDWAEQMLGRAAVETGQVFGGPAGQVAAAVGYEAARRVRPAAVETIPKVQKKVRGGMDEINEFGQSRWAPVRADEQPDWFAEKNIEIPTPTTPDPSLSRNKTIQQIDRFVPGYADLQTKSQARGELVEKFSVSLFDTIRDDPAGIAAETAAAYVLGGGIGGVAGLGVRAASKSARLAPVARAGVAGFGFASDVYDWTDPFLYAQGLRFDVSDLAITEITDGVRYSRGSDPYYDRLGEYFARNLAGNLAEDQSFGRTYEGIAPRSDSNLDFDDWIGPRRPGRPGSDSNNIGDQMSAEIRTMSIIGGDINAPELHPGRRMVDELPVGRGRGDELFVGDGFGFEIDPRMLDAFDDFAAGRSIRHGNRYGEEINNAEEYNYSSDPDFGNVVRNMFGMPELYGHKTKNENVYGNVNENDYGYRNRLETGFETAFNTQYAEEYAYEFALPRLAIPEFDMDLFDPNNKRPRPTRRKRSKTTRQRNPFLDLADFGRMF